MSKEQIEEMACDMCTVIQNCNEPYKPIPSCEAYRCAKRAYAKGYRRQSEVAREIFADFTQHKVCTNEEDYQVLAELKRKYIGDNDES